MKIDIDKLNEAELIDLNNRVVARLKFLSQMRAHAHMLDFSIGEKVSFQPDGQPVLHGIIAKYNRKSVTVITHIGQQWRVSQIRSAQLVGGGARSTLWAQLLADVLEIEVTVSGSASVGAALGAARLALLALSAQSPARIAQLCSKPPVDQRYTQYRACYAALQPVFQRAT